MTGLRGESGRDLLRRNPAASISVQRPASPGSSSATRLRVPQTAAMRRPEVPAQVQSGWAAGHPGQVPGASLALQPL